MQSIKVAICQQPLHEPLSEETVAKIRNEKVDFVSLPEHYPLPKEARTIAEAASLFDERRSYLADLSVRTQAFVIGGTLTEQTHEGYYNTCYMFHDGKEVGFYRKVYPTAREMEAGILQGAEFKVFELKELRVGLLICADVLNSHAIERMAFLGCHVVFIPTASPFRPGERIDEKYERDRSIFLEAAKTLGCPVVKCCGVGTTFGHPIQGRSLIATPDRIVVRAEPHQEQQALLLIETLEV